MTDKLKTKILELHEKYGDIAIRCQGASELPLDVIAEFQGDLKRLSQDNMIRLISSMFANGFCAPFFVWQHDGECYALDGHQRIKALCAIREAGAPIPGLLPVSHVFADTEAEARQKLLAITSQYGEFQIEQMDLWLKGIDQEIKDMLRFTDKEMQIDIFKPNENPEQSGKVVTKEEFDKKQKELENKYAEDNKKIVEVVCPECACVFHIQA